MTIHTFGDSHCMFGWSDNVIKHYLGPVLCYSFGMKKIFNINNFDIKPGDTVVYCLGEIDCRCHIKKHVTESRSFQNVIDDIINKYIEHIKTNILDNVQTCIYNVVPPVQKHNSFENISYPFVGTDEERKQYVLYFNTMLKEKCLENNFIFFDIYDKYLDNEGFLSKDKSIDDVHILNGIFIEEFIRKI